MDEMHSCFSDGVAALNTDIHGCEMSVNTKTEAKSRSPCSIRKIPISAELPGSQKYMRGYDTWCE